MNDNKNFELVFIPCEENHPQAVGGYQSYDGQSMCHVREGHVPASQPPAVKEIDATPFETNTDRHSVSGLSTAAGDGKEAMEFAAWLLEQQYYAQDGEWWKNAYTELAASYTTAELYDFYLKSKQQNK